MFIYSSSDNFRSLFLLLTAFLFSAGAFAASDADKIDPDKLTLKESKKIFKDEGDVDDAFEEKKKVLIAGYRVGFMLNAAANVMEQGESTQISNFSGADRVTYFSRNPDKHLTAIAKFKHDDALLQEITEEGYADLQARLKAVGREIVQMGDLKESEGYKKLEIAQPDTNGQYASEDDNGGLADVNYIAKKPESVPMWFGMANPLDKGGALAKAGTALSQKNMGSFKQLAIDADAVIIDMSFRVRPAWVQGIRPKMFRSASVKVDPYLVVLPELILVQTYKKTWVGNVPSYMGALRTKIPDFMDTEKAQKFPFYYGYDYGEFKVGEGVVDRSFFVPAYEKTTIVDINPDRAKFKDAVLHALKTTNATIAQWAKENPAK
jgi:hypothetical protein